MIKRAGDGACVFVYVHAPVSVFLTPALFCPLLIYGLTLNSKLMIGVDWE